MDSTNWQARLWARAGAPHGAAVVAGRQTAGRGRRGRTWDSAPNMGLWMSVVVRPGRPLEEYARLVFAAALAGADACRAATGTEMFIKWPNDLLLCGRKIVGILVEMEGDAAVVGIGINVRQREGDFPPALRETAGSLEMLTGRMVSLETLEKSFLMELERRVDAWDFMDEYARRCGTVGEAVRVISTDEEFCGVAEGMDGIGALLVQDEAGALRRVLAGDVSIRRLAR